MPNGVICGGAVDGSNQLGEIVTCQAMTTRPDGASAAAADAAPATVSAAARSRPSTERKRKSCNGLMRLCSSGDLLRSDCRATWRGLAIPGPRAPARRGCRFAVFAVLMADLSASDAAFLAETLADGLVIRRDNSQLAGCSVAVYFA